MATGQTNTHSNALEELSRLGEQCLAACEAALPRLSQESHLRVIHALIATHTANLTALAKSTGHSQQGVQTAVQAALARGSVTLGGLMGDSQVWEVVGKQQKALADAYSSAAKGDQLAPALHKQVAEQATAVLADLAEVDSLLHGPKQNEAQREKDLDEVTRGRAMPRVDAQSARIKNSVDY